MDNLQQRMEKQYSSTAVIDNKKERRRIKNRQFAKESRERSKIDNKLIRNTNEDYKKLLVVFAETLEDIVSVTLDAKISSNDAVGIINDRASFALASSKSILTTLMNEFDQSDPNDVTSVIVDVQNCVTATYSSANPSSSSDSFLIPSTSHQNYSTLFTTNIAMNGSDDHIMSNPPL